ncbi:MAG: hypothetical protein ABI837_15385, partial [Acidobacteriota bacterium]
HRALVHSPATDHEHHATAPPVLKLPPPMLDDEIQRNLPERTGRHYCISCLAEVPADAFFRNDHLCDSCAYAAESYPLESTPDAPPGTASK